MTATAIAAPAAAQGSRAILATSLGLLAGMALFGDYLALSASRLVTGEAGNWLLCAALVQVAMLGPALVLGRLRGALLLPETLCFLGLGAVMLLHLLLAGLVSRDLGEYGTQKLAAHFAMSGPALLCGVAMGRSPEILRWRWLVGFAGPLLMMCGVSLLFDPDRLTIAYYSHLYVFAGILVMPAHQALAFDLAKCALAVQAMLLGSSGTRAGRRAATVALGALVGLTLLSGARGYSLALLAGLGAVALRGRRRSRLLLVTAAAAYALYALVPSELVAGRYDLAEAVESAAYLDRREAWDVAWTAMLDRPLIGHGPGGFANLNSWTHRSYPHNLFLEVGSELGLLGLLALGAALACSVRRVVALRRRAPIGPLALFAGGFLAFALVGAMTVGDLIRNHFLWLGIGMLATVEQGTAAGTVP